MENVRAHYEAETTLRDTGFQSDNNPGGILDKMIHLDAWEETDTTTFLAILPEATPQDILTYFSEATRNKEEPDILDAYLDFDLPYRHDANQFEKALLADHLHSPLIGPYFIAFLAENPLYVAEVKKLLDRPFTHERVQIIDYDVFSKSFYKGESAKSVDRKIMLFKNELRYSPYMIPFLKQIGVPKEELDKLKRLSDLVTRSQWHSLEYNPFEDIIFTSLQQQVGKEVLAERLQAYYESLPLDFRISVVRRQNFHRDLLIDPRRRNIEPRRQLQDQVETVIFSDGTISIGNERYRDEIRYGEVNSDTGIYPVEVTKLANPMFGEGGIIPVVAWRVDRNQGRTLLPPHIARRLAGSNRAVNILGRAALTAVSPEVTSVMPTRMPLKQGEKKTNPINAVQQGTAGLMPKFESLLARQPVFSHLEQAVLSQRRSN